MDEPDATGTPVPTHAPTAAPGTAEPQPTATVTVTATPTPEPVEPTPTATPGATLQDVSDRLDHVSAQFDGVNATGLTLAIVVALAAGVAIVKAMR